MLLKKLHKPYDIIICCMIVLLFSALLILTMPHSDCRMLCDGGSGRYRFSDLGEKVFASLPAKAAKEMHSVKVDAEAGREPSLILLYHNTDEFVQNDSGANLQ